MVPWKGLIALIDPHYPKGEGGRPAYLFKRSALYKAKRKIEKAKAQVRAKVEHPFWVIKRPVDGAQTFTDQCRRGAPVIWAMAAARCLRRLKTQK